MADKEDYAHVQSAVDNAPPGRWVLVFTETSQKRASDRRKYITNQLHLWGNVVRHPSSKRWLVLARRQQV